MTLVPTMGSAFVVEAFVTVVVGGADIFLGSAPAALILGAVKAALTSWQGQLAARSGCWSPLSLSFASCRAVCRAGFFVREHEPWL